MVAKTSVSLLFAAAIASAAAVPLDRRADNALPTNLADILEMAGAIVGMDEYAEELYDAAQVIVSAGQQTNQAEVRQSVMSSLMSQLNQENNPTDAGYAAKNVLANIDRNNGAGIPTQMTAAVSTLASEMSDSQVITNVASIVDKVIDFVAYAWSVVPSAFEDPDDEQDDSPDAVAQQTSADSDDETNATLSANAASEGELTDNEVSDENKDSSNSSQESEHKSSSASAIRITLGLLPASVIVAGLASLF
ncbi:hypothetical protein GGI25_000604 [Coemansia spiralis]|uniref:Uncharacterized protein n=2 Tax=Coemansia TaxID=4863 RepID=A0A9W8L104_9FUNG|nr:hypothetical protein EDC05_000431 [Coemansia umbellata]KAJ2625505.1 hypothetical protein GGI26_000645 [Coemansia sp. RSA 1358]KAJ2680631.1 hypothetical protein GGI25_000604 [Coemansia spiralis]